MAHRSGARRPVGGAGRYRRARLQPRLLHLGLRGRGGVGRSVHRRARAPARRQRACAGALDRRRARHDPRQPDFARPLQRPFRAHLRRQGRARMVGQAAGGTALLALWRGDADAGARRPRLDRREPPRLAHAGRPSRRAISRPSPTSTATPPTSSAPIARVQPSIPRAGRAGARCRGRCARREVRRGRRRVRTPPAGRGHQRGLPEIWPHQGRDPSNARKG